MDTLPQELIHAIVNVDDNESLKMHSLVGPIFRESSQRVLLHTLSLGDNERDEPSTAPKSTVQNLLLLYTPGVVEVLTATEFKHPETLLATLNLYTFTMHDRDEPNPPPTHSLPPLPSLQSTEIDFNIHDSENIQFIDNLPSISSNSSGDIYNVLSRWVAAARNLGSS
ncbi:hypothetical protein B0H19DRAFT_1365160 [Mycena capillaripes]|nr:hypothetical protein B0H19DRAFT_1365160 [Mycena capillaripes]